jgi:flavin reductase (DIM6/NTAB) family NADH-FMN oxidoreductase RutF
MSIKTIDPKDLSQRECYHILSAAVAPRPICFASTINKAGEVNLSPYSFFNVFSSNPPIMVFSPNRSGRNNSTKNTHDNILEVPEVCINIVNHAMVEQMSLSSTAYAKGINEFVKSGLTPVPSDKIQPPRVGEAPVAFECKVNQVIALGNGPGAGSLVIAEVVQIHIQEQYLDAQGKLPTEALDLVARMGGNYYCRAIPEALFEIPKPNQDIGIGVDQLPAAVRNSTILTGNNLGRLGNLTELPSEEAVAAIARHKEVQKLATIASPTERRQGAHQLAQVWLEAGQVEEALCLLMWV